MKIEGGRAVVHPCQLRTNGDFSAFQVIFKDYSTYQNNNFSILRKKNNTRLQVLARQVSG